MAPKGARGKKVVSQEELRRLMREKKQSSERQKRVDSPHARYSSTGALSCALCKVQVKSEILWQVHVLSKQHREQLHEPKAAPATGAGAGAAVAVAVLKRKAAEPEEQQQKRIKGSSASGASGLPADFFHNTPGQSAGLGLLAGQYDNGNDEQEEKKDVDKPAGSTGDPKPPGGSDGLPADFFDSSATVASASHSGSVSKAEEEKAVERRENMAEMLPEGFFDDPVRDAKVRKVDTPKDHMDKEWEEFQKEMRQVSSASEAIVAEEDEEGRIERQIGEIDEQIECLRRVEALRSRQEAVRDRAKKKAEEERGGAASDQDEEEDEEEELLDVLARDWRAKGALA